MAKFTFGKWLLSLIFAVLVALMVTVAPLQTHDAHAATQKSMETSHSSTSAGCNYRTYYLTPTVELVRDDGVIVDLQTSNMNGYYTVKISHDGNFVNEYYLPYDDGSLHIDVGSDGVEFVNACTF